VTHLPVPRTKEGKLLNGPSFVFTRQIGSKTSPLYGENYPLMEWRDDELECSSVEAPGVLRWNPFFLLMDSLNIFARLIFIKMNVLEQVQVSGYILELHRIILKFYWRMALRQSSGGRKWKSSSGKKIF
jgi:hypothetical protein